LRVGSPTLKPRRLVLPIGELIPPRRILVTAVRRVRAMGIRRCAQTTGPTPLRVNKRSCC
jgi:hypothetical protein